MTKWKMTMREPSLDDLLEDEIMRPVMSSAGIDAAELRARMLKAAERLRCRHAIGHRPSRVRPGEECCCEGAA